MYQKYVIYKDICIMTGNMISLTIEISFTKKYCNWNMQISLHMYEIF